MTTTARIAEVTRNTAETRITVRVDLDGTGQARLSTGIGFFDHMLDQIARHGLIDLDIQAEGDLHIDGPPHGRRRGHYVGPGGRQGGG
jgi:imidazoleglycerol-phosphate dehydratase